MSTMDDIRAFMARQAGPVTPAQVAEGLDLEGKKVRQAMYQAANQAAGIEALDDGTYSLIPGWKPSRKAPSAKAETSTPAAPTKAATKDRKPAKVKAAEAKKPRTASKRASKPPRTAAAEAPARTAQVTVPRSCLTTLVAAVLDGDAPITGRLRSALREAAAATSQG